ncbi:MAG: hypothetical protein OJI67_10085, partial [Prosthecobacter sp.]|nr:hypothetical protein [Prosthecobacter sp.]
YDQSFESRRAYMLPVNDWQTPGEHSFTFDGAAGTLEAILTQPTTLPGPYVALLGHPHSLQGGSMNNKVVTTMARAFRELNIPSLRFNFRGVGASQGVYDAGAGESEDMLALMRLWHAAFPDTRFIFAGFSFGSYVAWRAAAQSPHALLISIAPAVHHYDYKALPAPHPWCVIQGDDDEVVPAQLVLDFAAQAVPPLPIVRFAETGHFFHGKLLELKTALIEMVEEQVLRS